MIKQIYIWVLDTLYKIFNKYVTHETLVVVPLNYIIM